MQFYREMASNPLGLTFLVITGLFIAFTAFSITGFVLGFLFYQWKNLSTLYTSRNNAISMHPYTEALLNNSAPELCRLRALQKRVQTPMVVEEMGDLLDTILLTLELRERNSSLRDRLMRDFGKLRTRYTVHSA